MGKWQSSACAHPVGSNPRMTRRPRSYGLLLQSSFNKGSAWVYMLSSVLTAVDESHVRPRNGSNDSSEKGYKGQSRGDAFIFPAPDSEPSHQVLVTSGILNSQSPVLQVVNRCKGMWLKLRGRKRMLKESGRVWEGHCNGLGTEQG